MPSLKNSTPHLLSSHPKVRQGPARRSSIRVGPSRHETGTPSAHKRFESNPTSELPLPSYPHCLSSHLEGRRHGIWASSCLSLHLLLLASKREQSDAEAVLLVEGGQRRLPAWTKQKQKQKHKHKHRTRGKDSLNERVHG